MSAEANIQTIKTAYDAFGRGDVDTMLGLMTDDVDWASEASTKGAPWYGPHHGKAEVAQFFQEFGGAVEVQEFSPVSFAGNDTDVFALVRYRGTARATGRSVSMDLHHYFRFRDGLVEYYRGTEDTAQTEWAMQE
jgi:uncharacterized protein